MGSEEALRWRSFLEKALDHNSAEISRVIVEHKLEGLEVNGASVEEEKLVGESSL